MCVGSQPTQSELCSTRLSLCPAGGDTLFQLGTSAPEPSTEPPGHDSLFHHTFVVMTSDCIIALWKRPRRAFKAADHTGEPG